MALFHELHREGHTLLMVTHDPLVGGQADRVVNLRDGRVAA
jgi:ABC-type lipoprotein export system ATPase subunit